MPASDDDDDAPVGSEGSDDTRHGGSADNPEPEDRDGDPTSGGSPGPLTGGGSSADGGASGPPLDAGAAARERDEEGTRSAWRAVAAWGSIGTEFGAGIVGFFLLGSWADATWGTDPWLRVSGAFLGIVLGTYLLIKKALASAPTDRDGRPPRPRR